MKIHERIQNLLPFGIPKKIRCYDNGGNNAGGSCDRYTVVFTGNYKGRDGCDYFAMNSIPFNHSYGIMLSCWDSNIIDYPTYSHLGKKIQFVDLPLDCQKAILFEYLMIWDITCPICNKANRNSEDWIFAKNKNILLICPKGHKVKPKDLGLDKKILCKRLENKEK